MKKQCLVLFILVVSIVTFGLARAESNNTGMGNITVNTLIGSGYTFISNDATETYGSGVSSSLERTQPNVVLGIQVLSDITARFRLGVEGSFTHWINESSDDGLHPLAPDGEEYCYHTVNTLALMEFALTEHFFVQAGSGLATAVGPFNRFTATTPYFMISPGMNFTINKKLKIPVMLRISSLDSARGDFGSGDGFGSILPLSLVTGISF